MKYLFTRHVWYIFMAVLIPGAADNVWAWIAWNYVNDPQRFVMWWNMYSGMPCQNRTVI